MSSLCLLGASLVYGAILTFLPIYAQQRNISDYGIFFVVYALATMGSRSLPVSCPIMSTGVW